MYKVYPKKKVIIGIDEVGRGSLAGPVCSAATVLDNKFGVHASESLITKLKDSKRLSFKTRNLIYEKIPNCPRIDQKSHFRLRISIFGRKVDFLFLNIISGYFSNPACF